MAHAWLLLFVYLFLFLSPVRMHGAVCEKHISCDVSLSEESEFVCAVGL